MNEPRKPKPGDCYIAFGRALNNKASTIDDLVKAAFECGLIISFAVQPDPNQSDDIEMTAEIGRGME